MPEHKPRTKTEKKAAVNEVMHEFSTGKLHSGSKSGPKVTNPKQAVAIAMSESGQSKSDNASGHPPAQTYEKHESREKQVMGAGYEAHEAAEREGWKSNGSHSFPQAKGQTHGFKAHSQGNKSGHLRMSGHSGAHRIGKR